MVKAEISIFRYAFACVLLYFQTLLYEYVTDMCIAEPRRGLFGLSLLYFNYQILSFHFICNAMHFNFPFFAYGDNHLSFTLVCWAQLISSQVHYPPNQIVRFELYFGGIIILSYFLVRDAIRVFI